uniref:C3H1-type domain-containing protein n=1 Tax=Pyrodinium bahamense TaxID=73915 RepID=A0A7S0A2R6_9DINO|mmetsp:Transcript_1997/g.5402  ORF Transcript_1997/g.5402 Transcript_1997/m.5402 type:complete len:242 (+) Transcript_1997:114-839(+)
MDEQFVYPAPLCVRNTFIDCLQVRPPSLDEFIQERLVKSCPTSGVSELDGQQLEVSRGQPFNYAPCVAGHTGTLNGDGDSNSECSTADSARATGGPRQPAHTSAVILELAREGIAVGAPQLRAPGSGDASGAGRPAGAGGAAPQSAGLLREAAAVEAGPAAGEGPQDLPSVGSAGHYAGRCKPCAFVNSKGCSIGKDCQFCHICEPGEKKRRQKEKRAFFSTMRRLQQSAAERWPGASSRR